MYYVFFLQNFFSQVGAVFSWVYGKERLCAGFVFPSTPLGQLGSVEAGISPTRGQRFFLTLLVLCCCSCHSGPSWPVFASWVCSCSGWGQGWGRGWECPWGTSHPCVFPPGLKPSAAGLRLPLPPAPCASLDPDPCGSLCRSDSATPATQPLWPHVPPVSQC